MRLLALPLAGLALAALGCAVTVRPEPPRSETISGMELVLIPGGAFEMGEASGAGEEDSRPVHTVSLPSFFMGRTEVTLRQWQSVMGSVPGAAGDPNRPVAEVSWFDVQEFLRKLKETSGRNYRLPTEAEWEYAARSGGRTEAWAGTSDRAALSEYAWTAANSGGLSQPVGTRRPNGLGLSDLTGNVAEWCQDWYAWSAYRQASKSTPQGPELGKRKVVRDCSFAAVGPGGCLTTLRDSFTPDYRSPEIGFRIVRSVE